MRNKLSALVFLVVVFPILQSFGEDKKPEPKKVLRIGGVASSPEQITLFKELKAMIGKLGQRAEYALYSDKDALDDALMRGEVDTAWRTDNTKNVEQLLSLKPSTKKPLPRAKDVVRIAGESYSPHNVTKFQNLKKYFNGKGFRLDFVLYSDFKEQVAAMERGEVDLMFSAPIPHAMYHLRAGGSRTLAMRDVDQGLRVTLVARTDSKVKSLKDLAGKRLVLGSSNNAEGALLPVHYLKKEGVNLDILKLVSLSNEKDAQGRRANTSQHVLKALGEGRGDAAVVLEKAWANATAFRKANPNIKPIWSSPEFCHCTITAPLDFDEKLGNEFTELITNMDPNDPLIAELNRLVHAKEWVKSDSEGFEALYEALENKEQLLKGTRK